MNKVHLLCLTTALAASSSLWAADTTNHTATVSNAEAEKAMPYGDKGMQNLGNSIQGASENTSQKMSEKWQSTKQYSAEQSEIVQEQTQKAKQYTAKKWQDTKDAVVGTNEGNVPIERAGLSQPSSN